MRGPVVWPVKKMEPILKQERGSHFEYALEVVRGNAEISVAFC